MTPCDVYLRMSDLRGEDDLGAREAKLRAEAARLGWDVFRVVIENDHAPNGDGRRRGVSAFKRQEITTPSGRTELRVIRQGFRSVLDDLMSGRVCAVLAEDLSRVSRDVRDGEDLLDACAARGASARSLSGNLTLTNGGTGAEIMAFRMFLAHLAAESADKAWRVAQSRERLAEKGTSGKGQYGGGRRPYGYRPDPDAVKYARTLLIVGEEAAELRKAAVAVMTGTSLKALARDLRERKVPTVTGCAWSAETLRDILLKPAVAGLAAHTKTIRENGDAPRKVTTLHPASWPPILDRELWEAICGKLTDPSRRTGTGNEPTHLLSGTARCHCGAPVKAAGGTGRAPAYVCTKSAHLRRNAAGCDELVLAYAAAYIQRDAATLLLPPARPGADPGKLRKEADRLAEIGKKQARMHALGDMPDEEYAEGARARKARLAAIAAQLAAQTEPDPLAEFRDVPDAGVVLAALPLPRQRSIVRLLLDITLLPATRRGAGFDASSVRVGPRTP